VDKHVFVWRPPETDITVFARAGRDAIERRLDGIALARATVHTTEHVPPRISLVPFRRTPFALISLVGGDTALGAAKAALAKLPGELEGYAVDEAVPIEPAPNARATLVTLFRQRPGLDRATFLSRWHGEHTPMALEIHPAVGYVRNVVREALLPGSSPWDGIVTEEFADERDVTTLRLFGRGPRALWNAARVGRHVSTFLDLASVETYLAAPHPAPV
jgi:hypothetical protein